MRYGFFSDVHANLEALQACVLDFKTEKIDKLFFLGDAVGYGPSPDESVKLINDISVAKLMGNHDYAALGLMETEYFNQYAAESVGWTKTSLSEKAIEIMSDFSLTHELDEILMVHSSPRDPEKWHYILDMEDAEKNFNYFTQKICLVGHTHRPYIVCKKDSGQATLSKETEEILNDDERYLINIGSLGQPRDGDPRCCYLIYDSDEYSVRFKRVEYDVKNTQEVMAKVGLPEYLIDRLAVGR
ncbi:MAG: metallophosphoesterase family protein [candidate division Zixibacteria bacterium]